MFTKTAQHVLPSGKALEIFRYQPDGDECPPDFRDYFLSSFVLNNKNPSADLGYWLADLHARLSGIYREECRDFFYGVKLDGQYAARMWFGVSLRSGIGNFGHVCTEPAFRKQGILNCLMQQFKQDFPESGAKVAGCATGNPVAAKCYQSHGFQLVYGGETGPLFYGEDYLALTEKAFAPGQAVAVRRGTPGDQFGCDKLLSYAPGVWGHLHPDLFPDFRCALLEQRFGSAIVCVAENAGGFPVGYAFVRRFGTEWLTDGMIHPGYRKEKEFLFEELRKSFAEEFPSLPPPQDLHKRKG